MPEIPDIPVTCKNCRRPIRWTGTGRTGWTHGIRDGEWQGVRCAGDISGAVPDVKALTESAYRAGREDAARQVADDLESLLTAAMRNGRENAGIDAYSGAGQVVEWIRRWADEH